MMKTLLITCLLLTLLPPVASLSCHFCWNKGTVCKNATIQKCDASTGQSCISAVGKAKGAGFGTSFVLKSCISSRFCHTGYSSASLVSDTYIVTKTSCCETDLCNSEPLEMPEHARRTNGLQCPTCRSFMSDNCRGSNTMKCRNEEDHCFRYGGRVEFGGESTLRVSARGCATADMCSFIDGVGEAGDASVRVRITHAECYPAKQHSAHEL